MNQTPIAEALPELLTALGETAWMTGWAFLITVVFGTALGVALRLTAPDGLAPNPLVYRVTGAITNVARSLPFLILLIALIPFTRWVVGTAYGPTAAIAPTASGTMAAVGP